MTNVFLMAQKRPYVLPGLLGALTVLVFIQFNVLTNAVPENMLFVWQLLSGVFLTGFVVYQLSLLLVRVIGAKSQSHYRAHRWVGVISVVLFAFHAVRFGYAWTNLLAIFFCLSALTGLLNREVIGYKSKWAYKTWYCLHVAISVNLLPLIAVHVWVALSFEGG